HRHFHEPGGGAGADDDLAPGAEQPLQRLRHVVQQLGHVSPAMGNHRPGGGREHVGVDFGRAGKKEAAERLIGHKASASCVVISETPRRSQTVRSWSARLASIGFMASVTAKSLADECRWSRPSMAYRLHTSRATP